MSHVDGNCTCTCATIFRLKENVFFYFYDYYILSRTHCMYKLFIYKLYMYKIVDSDRLTSHHSNFNRNYINTGNSPFIFLKGEKKEKVFDNNSLIRLCKHSRTLLATKLTLSKVNRTKFQVDFFHVGFSVVLALHNQKKIQFRNSLATLTNSLTMYYFPFLFFFVQI